MDDKFQGPATDPIPAAAAELTIPSDMASYRHKSRLAVIAEASSSGQGSIVRWQFWTPSYEWPTPTHQLCAEHILQCDTGFQVVLLNRKYSSAAFHPIDIAMDWAWMLSDSEASTQDFISVCDVLGIAATRIRRYWIEQYAAGVPALREHLLDHPEWVEVNSKTPAGEELLSSVLRDVKETSLTNKAIATRYHVTPRKIVDIYIKHLTRAEINDRHHRVYAHRH